MADPLSDPASVTTTAAPSGSQPGGPDWVNEPGDIPIVLTYTPVPYVALLGLNATVNELHLSIWNHFTQNRSADRPPIYFKLHPEKTLFPAQKEKKSSYEWHIPKGILKCNWMTKHLFQIPSVAVLFFELDWDDPRWQERRIECVSKIEFLRRSLQGRSTRIALVLIQQHPQMPGVEDPVATERMTLLCSTCDLSPKSLFVLPVNDPNQLYGYIIRMESAFFELSKTYYAHEAKLVKTHRDHLNKTTHQLLFVRHAFKAGFFSELKQDWLTASKHYKQAYASLMEVRLSQVNLHEVKTIAGFINYKVCRLSFFINQPLDAISYFKKHIDIFKNKYEPVELQFEHSCWLAKQFQHFAELFETAIGAGLVPSQIQHPGYYFYEAATHVTARRRIADTRCLEAHMDPASPAIYQRVIVNAELMEFFGQRPWRPGLQTLEPLDMQAEREGIKALQYKELQFASYSKSVISLLSNAANQFKKYKCPRLKRYMMVLIGKEYYLSQDYGNTLTILTQVLNQYRNEGWHELASSICRTALYAAYLSAKPQEFVKLVADYIANCPDEKEEESQTLKLSLDDVVARRVPRPPPGIDTSLVSQQLSNSWSSILSSESLTLPSREVVEQLCLKPSPDLSFHEMHPVSISTSFGETVESSAASYDKDEEPEEAALVDLNCRLPEVAVSRRPILVDYCVTNKLSESLPLDLSMGTSDSFMFSGNKGIRLILEPGVTHTEHYVLYPLTCGTLNLPQLHMVAFPDDVSKATPLDTLIETKFPATLLVLPQEKSQQKTQGPSDNLVAVTAEP